MCKNSNCGIYFSNFRFLISAGHGHSDGDRGFVEDMYDLVDDSLQHIHMVREEFPHIPLFICGHSMVSIIK